MSQDYAVVIYSARSRGKNWEPTFPEEHYLTRGPILGAGSADTWFLLPRPEICCAAEAGSRMSAHPCKSKEYPTTKL